MMGQQIQTAIIFGHFFGLFMYMEHIVIKKNKLFGKKRVIIYLFAWIPLLIITNIIMAQYISAEPAVIAGATISLFISLAISDILLYYFARWAYPRFPIIKKFLRHPEEKGEEEP